MKQLILTFFFINFIPVNAQYLNEIGFFVGGSNYSGDIGRETYIYPNALAGSVIYRRNLNERLTIRATFSHYRIYDDDKFSSNPVRRARAITLTNGLNEVAAGIEFNYWSYDVTKQRTYHTPYLFFEVAGFSSKVASSVANGRTNFTTETAFAIPLGIGYKSRITRRLSYAVELRARYALSDKIDYTDQNIPELNIGNPNTNDWYFFTGIGLTYSFGRPPCAVPRF